MSNMKTVLTSKQMKLLEKVTIDEIGIPSLVLIEHAAGAAFKYIESLKVKSVLVFAGNGNNGSDGYLLADMLMKADYDVKLYFTGNSDKRTEENSILMEKFKSDGGNIIDSYENEEAELYVDAMLGIGISRDLEGEYKDAVEYINSKEGYVLSLDIPTGINSDNGKVQGVAIKAYTTICFGSYKKGLFTGDGPDYTGKVITDSAGIYPLEYVIENNYSDLPDCELNALEENDLSEYLYDRKITGNKGTFGKVLIIAGSKEMKGAAVLSARGAMAVGAGMVKILTDKECENAYLSVAPELMCGRYNEISGDKLDKEFSWCDTVVIGPGLSKSQEAVNLVKYTILNCNKPVVADADALNILSDNMNWLEERSKKGLETVVTPHPMEFSRLFGVDIRERKYEDTTFLKDMASKYNLIIVAKNARTIIADKNECVINVFGNSGLARAGSGDILSGIIGGLLFPTKDNYKAAIAGVGFHALGGDVAAGKYSEYTLTSDRIIEGVMEAIERICQVK